MATEDQNPIYKFMKENNLTTKDEASFLKDYSTPEKRSEIYNFMKENQLTTKDEQQFVLDNFGSYSVGKLPEVSPIGSENTSSTLEEPIPSTSVPDQIPDQLQQAQKGELLGQSSEEYSSAILPEGATVLEGSDGTAYYDPTKAEDVRHINVLPDATVTGKTPDKGFISDVKNSFMSGLTEFNSGLAAIPEYLYRIAAVPQNLLADAIENNMGDGSAEWLRARYTNVNNGAVNPMRILTDYSKGQKQQSQQYSKDITQFEDDIIGSIGSGNFGSAGRQIFNSITQSIPAVIGMVATSGAGSAANLGMIGKNVLSALPFAAGAYQDIESNENMPENMKLVASGLKGLSEVVFEQGFGTQKLIESIASKAMGKEAVKEMVEGYMSKLLNSNGMPASAFKGAVSEGATTLAQNMISKYSGEKPDQDLWEGVADAMIVGGVMDAGISGAGKLSNTILDSKDKKRATELESQITALSQDNTSEATQSVLESKTEELDNIVNENENVLISLPKPDLDKIRAVDQRIAQLESGLSDVSLEESKKAIQDEIDSASKERESIYKDAMVTTKQPSTDLTPERIDESVIAQRKVAPELENVPMGVIEVPDTTFDTIAKIDAKEAIPETEITSAVDSLYEKKKELKSLLKDPNRVQTSSEINEAISGLDRDIEALSNYSGPGISSADFTVVNPGDQFAEGTVKSTAINEDGSVDVTMTDGTILNSKDYVTEKEVQPVSSEETPVTPVENNEVAPVGEKNVPAKEVVEPIVETNIEENENITESIPVVEEIRQPDKKVDAKPEQVKIDTETRSNFANENEYNRYVAETSNNPDEIAIAYDQSTPSEYDFIEQAIMEDIGTSKINEQDYSRYGDRNNLDKAKRDRWIDKNNKGISLDVAADQLSRKLGIDIDPSEYIEFIDRYKNQKDFKDSKNSDTQRMLKEKYKELTGRNLTDKIARRTRDRVNRNMTDEQRFELNESLQEVGITYDDIVNYEKYIEETTRSNAVGLQQPSNDKGSSKAEAPRNNDTQGRRKVNTPKSLLEGVVSRLKKTGLAKSVKIADSQGISDMLGRMNNVNFQVSSLSNLLNIGIFSKGDFKKSLSGNVTGVRESVLNDIAKERSDIESKAKRRGNWLKAPNGQRSNLNADQWVTVRTSRFKEWFGDWEKSKRNSSKILDKNGEPAIYYNGSKTSFNEYDKKYFYTGEGAMHYGAGFYFTPRLETANSYSRQSVLGEYSSRVSDIVASLPTDKLQSLTFKIPAINSSDFNKSVDNFNKEFDTVLSDIKKRLDRSNDNIDKNILQDVYHSFVTAKDNINSFISENKRKGSNEPISPAVSIRLSNVLDNSSTLLSRSSDTGVGMGTVASLFLNVRNPLNWEASANPGLISKVNDKLKSLGFPAISLNQKTNGGIYSSVAESLNEPMVKGTNFRQYSQTSDFFNSIGIDGVLHTTQSNWTRGAYFDQAAGEVQVIAFEPNQIKSAENQGTFNNTLNDMRFQQGNNSINGFVDEEGNIVINSDTAGLDTPIHEFAHIWEQTIENTNPALHARGIELIQTPEGKVYIDYVNKTQPGLSGDALYKEALAQAIGDSGARLINSQKSSPIKEWLKNAWDYIGSLAGLSQMSAEKISKLTLSAYADAAAVDLLSGKEFGKLTNGDLVIKTTAKSLNDLSVSEKKISDFMEKMRAKNNLKFQGSVDSGQLTDAELLEFVDVVEALKETGQVSNFTELRAFAETIGITDVGQVRFAWNAMNVPIGMQKRLMSAKTILDTKVEKMTKDELTALGKQMVDEGFINPEQFIEELVTDPLRGLKPYEVPAFLYIKTLNENAIDEYAKATDDNGKAMLEAKLAFARDMELAQLNMYQQAGMTVALFDTMTDRDFNVLEIISDMSKVGDVSEELRARLEALGNEMQIVKSELRDKAKELEKAKAKAEQSAINKQSNSKPKKENSSMTGRSKKDALDVLDSLDLSSFGVGSVSFQTNGVLRFSVNSSSPLFNAMQSAVEGMKQSISDGTSNLVDSLETAVSQINDTVGKGNWDEMKFRSDITNSFVNKGHSPSVKKPYVSTDGKLVVPSKYIQDVVSTIRSNNGGKDASIEEIVSAVSNDVGPQFNEREIRDSITGYGRAVMNTRTDEQKNIAIARSIGKLLSELQDLEDLGPNPKSKNTHVINERVAELRQLISNLTDSMTSTPEEKAQAKMERAAELKKKYMQQYIAKIEQKIADGDFAPADRTPKYDFSNDPEVIALEEKREEIRNKFKEAKYKHELDSRTRKEIAIDFLDGLFFGLPRSMSAGADISSFLIQGGLITFANPKLSGQALTKSLKAGFNEDTYNDYFHNLQRDPMFEIARKAKLNMQLPNFYQNIAEEQLGGGNLATVMLEGIVDAVIKNKKVADGLKKLNPFPPAERQYAVYLSDVRFNLFKQVATDAMAYQGIDPATKEGQEQIGEIAKAVNDITMASNLTTLEGANKVQKFLNLTFFSMRKMAANFKVLTKLPMYTAFYAANKIARATGRDAYANKTELDALIFERLYGRYAGVGLATMSAAVLIPTVLANASYDDKEDEEPPLNYNPNVLNPIHSDFMKLRIGDTRWSPFLGMDGVVVLMSRLATQSYMTSSSNEVKRMGAKDSNTSLETLANFFKNKLAPTPAIIAGLGGSDFAQRETSERVAESLYPMWISSAIDEYELSGGNMSWTAGSMALGIMGVNFNTYGGAEFASYKGTKNKEAYDIMTKVGLSDYTPDFRNKEVMEDGSLVQELSKSKMKKVFKPAYEEFMTAGVIAKKNIILDPKKTLGAKESQLDNLKKEAYRYAELKSTGAIIDYNFRTFTHEGQKYALTKNQYKEKIDLINKYIKNEVNKEELSYIKDDVLAELDESGIKRDPNYIKMRIDLKVWTEANSWVNKELSDTFKKGKYIPLDEYDKASDQFSDTEVTK